MSKRKICFVITTRGNYAKLKPIIRFMRSHNIAEVQVVVAGGALLSKYGNIADVVKREFEIDRRIPFIIEGENLLSMAKSSGIALSEFATAFDNLEPDCVVLVGDRYETLAISMASAYMNIPVAHIEGGEVSGSIDESVRHALTKIAHLHFPCCSQAAERIKKLGEQPETIHIAGSTSLDSMLELDLKNISPLVEAQSKIGVGPVIDIENGYILVLFHPVTTEYDKNQKAIDELIRAVEEIGMPTIWIWPNMDAGSDIISQRIRTYRELIQPSHIHFFKSLPVELFGPALYNCSCILGNSSSGIRESAFFGVPSVTVGSRQNGRDLGPNVIKVAPDHKAILLAVRSQLAKVRYEPDYLYGDGKSAERIADVLANVEITIQKRITF